MTIDKITVKFLGKKETIFRAIQDGEVVQVFETKAEAEAWVAEQ